MGEPTYLTVLTPPGRGAIATLALRGPRAVEIASRRFTSAAGQPLTAFPVGRVVFGRFRGAGQAIEEVVIGLVGPGEVEVHCHGGTAAASAAAAALVAEGAQRIEPAQWARRSGPDAIAAEALLALAEARTERTAGILLDQARGALAAAVRQVSHSIATGDLRQAEHATTALLARAEFGRHLTRPWQVVLAGPPNVGKSSLLNALLGYERSIVFDEPGTTRDVLTAAAAFDGWPVELYDTAGLREAGDPLEADGVERARRQIATADLVLLVCDATTRWADMQPLTGVVRTLVVHNKTDLAPPPADGRPAGIAVSALTGEGIANLVGAIATGLIPQPPEPGVAVPFTPRQVELLAAARAAMERGNWVAAAQRLGELIAPPPARSP